MFTPSDKCPRRDACVRNGKGLIHMKDLTDQKGLYDHGRLFAHVTIDPGCSIGDHPHDHETEFYYIIKGEGVFNDNGTERHRLRRGPRPGEPGHRARGAHRPDRSGISPQKGGPPAAFFLPRKKYPRSLKVFSPPDRTLGESAPKELRHMDYMEQAERLARTYADPILRLSYTYLKNTHDAQDICQTVFVKLLTEPREFESPEHERAYILRMAANACKDLLKSPWRQRSQALDEGLQVPAPEASDGSVLEAVNQLPPLYRAVIYLFYYEGYQAAEIGQILGIPTATVHTRLARGRTKLKELLGGYGYEQSV